MSYSNLDILSVVLVGLLALLLYCENKKANEGLGPDGLKFRSGYSALPKHGRFSKKEGYVVGAPSDLSRSYTRRKSRFDGFDDQPAGLNGLENDGTNVKNPAALPNDNVGDILWMPDAEIPRNVYNRDDVLNDVPLTESEDENIMDTVFARNRNKAQIVGSGSLGGAVMQYTDYGANMQPTRLITN